MPSPKTLRVVLVLLALIIAAQFLNIALQRSRPSEPPQRVTSTSLLADARAPTLGPRNATVTITLFSDYACPICRVVHRDLRGLLASDPGVRIVYRDWPVLGPRSVRAAQLALASTGQGRHAEFDDALMTKGGSLDEAALHRAAGTAGLNWDRLEADLAANQKPIDERLAANDRAARALDFRGTPSLAVGPYLVAGRVPIERLRELVAEARR